MLTFVGDVDAEAEVEEGRWVQARREASFWPCLPASRLEREDGVGRECIRGLRQ